MPNQELLVGVLSWLCTYAVHSSVLLGAVWLLLRWRGPRSLALRERLWKLALVGPLLTASLQLALGARPLLGRFEWRPSTAQSEPHVAPRSVSDLGPSGAALAPAASEAPAVVNAQEPAGARPARQAPPSRRTRADAPSASAPAREAGEPDAAPTVTRSEPTRPTSVLAPVTRAVPRISTPPSWPGVVLVLWGALGLFGVVCVAGSFMLLWRRLQGREMLREGPLVETLETLRRRAGLRRHVRLSISSRVAAPFSTGILLPEICLPRAVVAGLTPAQQEVLLAHELGHILRRDPFWFAAGTVLERLFFFQPLNRVARHELAELAELACDDCAVRWTGSRLALASCLTEVAGWLIEEPRRQLALPGLTAPRSPLGRRITRLLDDRRSPSAEPRAKGWPVLALGTLGLTVVAVPGISAASPAPAALPALAEKVDLGPPVVRTSAANAPSGLDPTGPRPAMTTTLEPAPETLALDELRVGLERELARLAAELDALRLELEQRGLEPRFAAELAAIEGRLAALQGQHARASALLARLMPVPHTQAPAAR